MTCLGERPLARHRNGVPRGRDRGLHPKLAGLCGDAFVRALEEVFWLNRLATPDLLMSWVAFPSRNQQTRCQKRAFWNNVPVSARDERLTGNEALFREVNERVAEVATQFIEVETHTERVDFTCECGRDDCTEPIAMTIAEYEAIRAESTHFAVAPQHEQPEIEIVIERHPNYFVVEKREQDAQEVARETDPRT
jgi:hypothetical protein